jgi:hypothetical protein
MDRRTFLYVKTPRFWKKVCLRSLPKKIVLRFMISGQTLRVAFQQGWCLISICYRTWATDPVDETLCLIFNLNTGTIDRVQEFNNSKCGIPSPIIVKHIQDQI